MEKDNSKNEVSISIFPFENLTGRADLDGLCKSFHIDLLTEFSRFRQFKIVPHELITADGIAPEYSFQGSFRYQNDHLKVNARLINNHRNVVTWAGSHEIEKEVIFNLQEDLLRQVITALQLQVNYDLLIGIRKKSPSRFSVYEHWLFGMEELKKGTIEADESARYYFEQAIKIDPVYSLAYSGMSLTYFNEWSCQLWERWDACHKGAFEWAKKAIELDEQNYVAAMVLGRVYLYESEYDIAEHYLRKALRLNPNDTDCVMQITSCFVYLGLTDEAETLYNQTPQVSELKFDYAHIGSLIAFEKGEFRKCVELGSIAKPVWIDSKVMMAAAYFELNDFGNMERWWNKYTDELQKKVMRGEKVSTADAIQWVIDVSPYKKSTRLMRFLEYISGEKISFSSRSFQSVAQTVTRNMFLKEDSLWVITFENKTIRMPDAKGLIDIHKLISKPDTQVHCTELIGAESGAQPVLVFDEKAKHAYKQKILELQEDIRLAETNNDFTQTSVLQQEYDDILNHLNVSLGLKGRIRKANDPIEKTRSAVTWRIRNVIRKIEPIHPALGRHLSASVKTGTFCSYSPEKPVQWLFD